MEAKAEKLLRDAKNTQPRKDGLWNRLCGKVEGWIWDIADGQYEDYKKGKGR